MTVEPTRPAPVIGKRQRRLLRAVLPVGVLLLIMWVVRTAVGLVVGGESVLSAGGAAIGVVTSLVLIWSGWTYRRDLAASPAEPSTRDGVARDGR